MAAAVLVTAAIPALEGLWREGEEEALEPWKTGKGRARGGDGRDLGLGFSVPWRRVESGSAKGRGFNSRVFVLGSEEYI